MRIEGWNRGGQGPPTGSPGAHGVETSSDFFDRGWRDPLLVADETWPAFMSLDPPEDKI